MTTSYLVFGLHLRSNVPLLGIPPSDLSIEFPEVRVYLGLRPQCLEENKCAREDLVYTNANPGHPSNTGLCIWRTADNNLLRINYPDGTQFWLDNQRKTVWGTWPDTSSVEEASTYLLGPILGLLLRLRGTTCLHASAVDFGGQSVAFLGGPGAGKSTTAAALARRGHAVLSDDIVVLEERKGVFFVIPAYPHLSLWPDSVNLLYGSPDALPRFSANWEKRCLALGLGEATFASQPLRLAAIYILGERRKESAPRVEEVRPQLALISVLAETYANKLLSREMRAEEFAVLARLIAAVPTRTVFPPSDGARLRDLCEAIEADVAILKNSTMTRLDPPE